MAMLMYAVKDLPPGVDYTLQSACCCQVKSSALSIVLAGNDGLTMLPGVLVLVLTYVKITDACMHNCNHH